MGSRGQRSRTATAREPSGNLRIIRSHVASSLRPVYVESEMHGSWRQAVHNQGQRRRYCQIYCSSSATAAAQQQQQLNFDYRGGVEVL